MRRLHDVSDDVQEETHIDTHRLCPAFAGISLSYVCSLSVHRLRSHGNDVSPQLLCVRTLLYLQFTLRGMLSLNVDFPLEFVRVSFHDIHRDRSVPGLMKALHRWYLLVPSLGQRS